VEFMHGMLLVCSATLSVVSRAILTKQPVCGVVKLEHDDTIHKSNRARRSLVSK
jgi:hypothetical protein